MIEYSIIQLPAAKCILAEKNKKIAFLEFVSPNVEDTLNRMYKYFNCNSSLCRKVDCSALHNLISLDKLLNAKGNNISWEDFHLQASELRLKVWKTLFNLNYGQMVSYEEFAKMCGMPSAVRAIATAIGKNPVSLIIPCHRVIRKGATIKDKNLGNYRWGADIKLYLNEYEQHNLNNQK